MLSAYDAHVRLRPHLFVEHDRILAERHPLADEDVHFAGSLVAAVLEDLTRRGDRVLDPFAGFGTTLRVAEAMGRYAVGVELLPERCAAAAYIWFHRARWSTTSSSYTCVFPFRVPQ